jgi:hypothetical protein
VTGGSDQWIRWTTTGCVALLVLTAETVSYLHMHMLMELYGQPGWVAALTRFSVDGMIVAASTTLLADRLVKHSGVAGELASGSEGGRSGLRLGEQKPPVVHGE